MNRTTHKSRPMAFLMIVLAIAIALPLFLTPDAALARRGGDDDRVRFYGIVDSMPDTGFQGTWVIGGRTVETGPGTQFDQTEGKLEPGACVKVDIRGGRVHEIDSEPMRDCR